ncbi:LOW QUALITY PROTEIN: hypothetical protein NC651_037808 [Populus alba x Populus x berolinensis]|nr:LOW QUALITY PROTEIN: hypothetical protein NC651_037808 [Populus alba x Populus x berolinensis]
MGRPPCCDKIRSEKKDPWTPEEDIILNNGPGNWRAVPTSTASYLPQRTDNDIKNFWNTHLKKKLRKLQAGQEGQSRDGLSSSHKFLEANGREGFKLISIWLGKPSARACLPVNQAAY